MESVKVECLKKKLVVLDLNGVLADLVDPPPNDEIADAIVAGRIAIFKRPFYAEFLNFCFDNFEVGIWSAGKDNEVEAIVDYLLGENKNKLLFLWSYTDCTKASFNTPCKKKSSKFKDLRKIWDKQDPNLNFQKGYFNETNTLLIDDSPHKALLNPPHTSIFPHSFHFLNKSDNSLGGGGDLTKYLNELANVENIQKYVEEHPFGQQPITETSPSWNFYFQLLQSLSNSA
ncbi:hypothetical protein PIB30_007286 [Stylosanthes scabra]|uniref:Mitochondrial import inner membrane translocase subunit TIM50 n=1 Tax=Stylosanthes scabra TaxID=79078 RepID=A0ABU6W464_9FABA|nr:hypothetical protein [Stylosanthes scabra]